MNRTIKILSFISLAVAIMSSIILFQFTTSPLSMVSDIVQFGFRLYIIILIFTDIILAIPTLINAITKKFKNLKFYLICRGTLIVITLLSFTLDIL